MTDDITPAAADAVAPDDSKTKHPEHAGVALFFNICKDKSLSVELQLEAGHDNIDPRDPAHVLAFFVQHNALELMAQASLWLMTQAKAEKERRKGGGGPAGAPAVVAALPLPKAPEDDGNVIEMPRDKPILVDSSGTATLQH